MTRRRSSARLVTTVAGMAVAAVLALCGYAVVASGGAEGPGGAGTPSTPGTPSAQGGRDAGVPAAAEARALLAALPVKGSAPATGYDLTLIHI